MLGEGLTKAFQFLSPPWHTQHPLEQALEHLERILEIHIWNPHLANNEDILSCLCLFSCVSRSVINLTQVRLWSHIVMQMSIYFLITFIFLNGVFCIPLSIVFIH